MDEKAQLDDDICYVTNNDRYLTEEEKKDVRDLLRDMGIHIEEPPSHEVIDLTWEEEQRGPWYEQ